MYTPTYLTRLPPTDRNQLGQAAAQVERAAGGLQEGRERSSSEVALACRSLLGMLSQELWRKQALVARATAALGPLVLHLAAGGYGLDAVEVAAAAVQEVARAWPLDGSASFVDVTLGTLGEMRGMNWNRADTT